MIAPYTLGKFNQLRVCQFKQGGLFFENQKFILEDVVTGEKRKVSIPLMAFNGMLIPQEGELMDVYMCDNNKYSIVVVGENFKNFKRKYSLSKVVSEDEVSK